MRELVTHGGLEPPASRSQTERDAITPMSDETRLRLGGFEQGFAVGILPMNRLPGSPRLRASAGDFPLRLVVDNRRRSARKGEKKRGLLRNGQENGLRSRGLVHPEHALCLAELLPE